MIEEVKAAIKSRDIDKLLILAKHAKIDEIDTLIELYESFYTKEMIIAKTVQNVLARIKIKRIKNSIPNLGNYTYKLEE